MGVQLYPLNAAPQHEDPPGITVGASDRKLKIKGPPESWPTASIPLEPQTFKVNALIQHLDLHSITMAAGRCIGTILGLEAAPGVENKQSQGH